MINFKTFFEAFKISKAYNPKKVKDLEAKTSDLSNVKINPDTLLKPSKVGVLGDSITFAFVNGKGYVSKAPNVGHEKMKLPDYEISGRAGFTDINGVKVPVVAFWVDYYKVEPFLAQTFKLIKSVSPKFPGPNDTVISTRDRTAWYKDISKAVSSEDRAIEMDLRKKLHTETDSRRKRIYMQMLGMLPQMKKPAMPVSGD